MKNKQLLIAIVVLVVLGAAVIFTKEDSGKSSSSGESTKPTNQVIETLDATKLASITLTDSDGSVTVDQVDGKWSVTDRDGFPANFSNIQSLVDTVTELKILAKQKVGKSQLGRFELNDPAPEDAKDAGTKLELKDADGNVLHSILFGKETQGQADPSSPFGPSGTGRYVLVAPNTVGEINETLSSDLKTSPADWLHKEDFLKVEKIKSITITQPNEADSWTLTRVKEADDMALTDAKPEEKMDSSKGNTAGRVFGYPSFDDVASKSAKPEDIGMDKAVTATIDTFEGYNYIVKMAKQGDDHYISINASGTGTPARRPLPNQLNSSIISGLVRPPVSTRDSPVITLIVPMVAISGLRPRRMASRPLTPPRPAPSASARAQAVQIPVPSAYSSATTPPESPATAATTSAAIATRPGALTGATVRRSAGSASSSILLALPARRSTLVLATVPIAPPVAVTPVHLRTGTCRAHSRPEAGF